MSNINNNLNPLYNNPINNNNINNNINNMFYQNLQNVYMNPAQYYYINNGFSNNILSNQNIIYNQVNNQNFNENKNNKDNKIISYKPKSLKEYKEKYMNKKEKERGGLGANIGTEEWEKKEKIKKKVKEFSEKIKENNEEKENNNKKEKKLNKIQEQLYDSLSEDDINNNNNSKEKKFISVNEVKINDDNLEKENNVNNNSFIKINFLKNLKKKNMKKPNSSSTSEKKLGRIYTTLKQPPINYNGNKINKNIENKNNFKTPFDKKSKSSNKKNIIKDNKYKYIDDELTKKFMINKPNEYNGLNENKIDNNNINNEYNTPIQIETLLENNKNLKSKVNKIKEFINNIK